MPENKTPLRRLHPNVWVVTATSFLTDISSEMLVYLIPLFLSNVLGVRMAFIGLIDGVAETTASLVKIYSGALSDKLGKRKWLAVLGYGILDCSQAVFIFREWLGRRAGSPLCRPRGQGNPHCAARRTGRRQHR